MVSVCNAIPNSITISGTVSQRILHKTLLHYVSTPLAQLTSFSFYNNILLYTSHKVLVMHQMMLLCSFVIFLLVLSLLSCRGQLAVTCTVDRLHHYQDSSQYSRDSFRGYGALLLYDTVIYQRHDLYHWSILAFCCWVHVAAVCLAFLRSDRHINTCLTRGLSKPLVTK